MGLRVARLFCVSTSIYVCICLCLSVSVYHFPLFFLNSEEHNSDCIKDTCVQQQQVHDTTHINGIEHSWQVCVCVCIMIDVSPQARALKKITRPVVGVSVPRTHSAPLTFHAEFMCTYGMVCVQIGVPKSTFTARS